MVDTAYHLRGEATFKSRHRFEMVVVWIEYTKEKELRQTKRRKECDCSTEAYHKGHEERLTIWSFALFWDFTERGLPLAVHRVMYESQTIR